MKSIIDETWTCTSCGSWNAPWLEKCGKCNETKKKNKNEEIKKFGIS